MKQVQDIIRDCNALGVSPPVISTFLYLWTFKKNRIQKSQSFLAKDSQMGKRRLRDHLYKLINQGFIEYHRPKEYGGEKTIELRKYRHNE